MILLRDRRMHGYDVGCRIEKVCSSIVPHAARYKELDFAFSYIADLGAAGKIDVLSVRSSL